MLIAVVILSVVVVALIGFIIWAGHKLTNGGRFYS
jgi:hypothetical protein